MEELSDRCYPRNYFDPYGNEKEEMECCETCGELINDCQCIDWEECGKPTMVEDFVLDPRPMELENVCKECEKKFLAELVQGVNSSSHHPKPKGDSCAVCGGECMYDDDGYFKEYSDEE